MPACMCVVQHDEQDARAQKRVVIVLSAVMNVRHVPFLVWTKCIPRCLCFKLMKLKKVNLENSTTNLHGNSHTLHNSYVLLREY